MTKNKRFTTDNGSNEDVCLVDNITGKEYESNFCDIVDLLNKLNDENEQLKMRNANLIKISAMTQVQNDKLKLQNEELLYQIGEVGKNNKTCRECECFIPENKYCYMWDMEVEADDVVVACDQRKIKNINEMISDD